MASYDAVIRDPEGRRTAGGTLEEVYVFDTQFTHRERQCLIEQDGGFEVVTTVGQVVVSHALADRPVCEGDEVVLGRDGALDWQ